MEPTDINFNAFITETVYRVVFKMNPLYLMQLLEDITRPLNSLNKKDISFAWTKQCKKTFQILKKSLMAEPFERYPDPKNLYMFYINSIAAKWR